MKRYWSAAILIAIALVSILYAYEWNTTLVISIVIAALAVLTIIYFLKNKLKQSKETLPDTKYTYSKNEK
tara:strand:- start:1392 stop:1601 length:210 start_codon:yes stop_codon:yes gene_type:complete